MEKYGKRSIETGYDKLKLASLLYREQFGENFEGYHGIVPSDAYKLEIIIKMSILIQNDLGFEYDIRANLKKRIKDCREMILQIKHEDNNESTLFNDGTWMYKNVEESEKAIYETAKLFNILPLRAKFLCGPFGILIYQVLYQFADVLVCITDESNSFINNKARRIRRFYDYFEFATQEFPYLYKKEMEGKSGEEDDLPDEAVFNDVKWTPADVIESIKKLNFDFAILDNDVKQEKQFDLEAFENLIKETLK